MMIATFWRRFVLVCHTANIQLFLINAIYLVDVDICVIFSATELRCSSVRYLFEFTIDPFALTKEAGSQINKYVGEARKRNITVKPASYADDKSNREIFVLLIDVPELKNQLAIFYD